MIPNPNNKSCSVSMCINKKDKDILPLKSVYNGSDEKKTYIWKVDEVTTHCFKCNFVFSFINRKHHCRNCGNIFCGDCSNWWVHIPKFINSVPENNVYWNTSTYIKLLNNNKQRTCQDCFTKINELKELIKIMEIFDLLPLNIIVYKNIAIVCKSWNKVSCYYQSFLKDMQCYLPDHNYTKKELSILKNNYSLFHGHSKWIVQIIINQVKLNLDTSDILQIIENKKHYNCLALNCTGQCNDVLQTEDVIICLYCNISDINIIKYIITFKVNPLPSLHNYNKTYI